MKRTFAVELAIITLLGCIYFFLHAPVLSSSDVNPPTLDLRSITALLSDDSIRPIGLEHERLAGTILPIRIGLQRYGHIPTWNSLLSNGVPITNNAFSYFFNPFHSLPVLLLGGVAGSKLAIFIALLIAGYSMWTFGLAIGLGTFARITIALLYMFNGSIAAKFGAGHFQLACSLAWPPLVFATLWWTLHTTKRIAPVAFGISFTLLFYAGNIYYVLHTLVCCLIIAAPHLIERAESHWRFRRDRLQRIFLAGVFAFGLAALQFFPIWQTRDFVTHEQQRLTTDGSLENNYDFAESLANITTPWQAWIYNQPATLFPAVDYAYVGNLVFVLIGFALITVIVVRSRLKYRTILSGNHSRLIIAALVLAVLMMLWAGGQIPPFPWLYAHVPLLAQFRFLGRTLAVADLWWIVLAGIVLDYLWDRVRDYAVNHGMNLYFHSRLVWASAIVTAAWLFLVIYSASSSPHRILMVLRNVSWWQQLDTLRYTSLLDAFTGLLKVLAAVASIDLLITIIQHRLMANQRTQTSRLVPVAIYGAQMVLIAVVAFGLLDVAAVNLPALQFSVGDVSFDAVYDAIRQVDPTRPFPSVSIPFSPFTFGAYEREIRIWSLNEGWSPAAPQPSLSMGQFSNLPRWLITQQSMDGSFVNPGSKQFIETYGYELRACYVKDGISLILSNCSVRQTGYNLYEYPQALPYAFVTTNYDLRKYPTTLHADQVQPADVLLYQQDNMVIHAADYLTDFDQHYLVVQEANFPGWQITIDGQPVQPVTIPTYIIGDQTLGLIAIPTEKGDHTYALRFDPPGLTTGILVFLGTLSLIAVYLTYRHKQKSPA